MSPLQREKYLGALLGLLSVLWIGFILTRSMKPASLSSEESTWALHLVQEVLPRATDHFVRKLAHFTEFFVLGLLLGGCCGLLWRPVLRLPLLGCVGIAALDELVQRFYEGRSGELRDVLLDSLGALCALLLLRLFSELRKRRG